MCDDYILSDSISSATNRPRKTLRSSYLSRVELLFNTDVHSVTIEAISRSACVSTVKLGVSDVYIANLLGLQIR